MFISKGSLAEACSISPSIYIENRATQPQPGPIFSPVFRIQGQASESFLKNWFYLARLAHWRGTGLDENYPDPSTTKIVIHATDSKLRLSNNLQESLAWPCRDLENFPFLFPKTIPLTSVNNKQLGFQVEKAALKHPGTSAEPLVSREINLKFKYNLELAQSMFIV